MNMKRIRVFAAAMLAAALLAPMGVLADPSYTGEIDPATNEPYADENQQATEENGADRHLLL